jgi:hypothetical protein
VRYPVSKTGGLRPWGFDSLSFRLSGGMAEWKGSALLPRRAACRSAGSNPAASASSFRCGRAVRRATVNREAQVRSLPPELVARPRGRTGYDAGLSIRKLRVRVPPGVLTDRSPARLRRAMMTSIGIDFIQRWEADAGKPASACRSTAACRGDGPPRRLWAPEIAGSTPAGQIAP